jgi:cell division protein FtsB
MANRRRNQSGAVRFVPALKAVLLCSLIGGFCVGYVIQKNKIFELGQQIGTRQAKLEKLKKDNQDLASTLATLQRPMYLAQRVNELKLGLVQPQPQQIIWIAEPLPQSARTNGGPVQMVQTKP